MAFYLLKGIADFAGGKATVLTDAVNISPKSYTVSSPLISQADTVKCRGGGGGQRREALMRLN